MKNHEAKGFKSTPVRGCKLVAITVIGVGATADELSEFGSSDPKFAGGLGFRYLIARKLRLASGVDIARGPEDWAIYFTVGTGL